MTNIAIFASGSGSNAENIVNYFKTKNTAKINLILTNNPTAYVIERSKKLGIKNICFTKEEMKNGILLNHLKNEKIDFIVLAGFLLLIPAILIENYKNRIINIHPALLPKYGGKGMYGDNVHKAVIENKEKFSGITIHFVNENYDEGSIIFQQKCEVLETDTYETLATKIHKLEYENYPVIIEKIITNLI